jgi:hypothetical protein
VQFFFFFFMLLANYNMSAPRLLKLIDYRARTSGSLLMCGGEMNVPKPPPAAQKQKFCQMVPERSGLGALILRAWGINEGATYSSASSYRMKRPGWCTQVPGFYLGFTVQNKTWLISRIAGSKYYVWTARVGMVNVRRSRS